MVKKTKKLSEKDRAIIIQVVSGATIIGILISLYTIFMVAATIDSTDIEGNKFIIAHQKYDLLFLAYLIPIAIALLGRHLANSYMIKKNEFAEIMQNKNAIITNNALFAKSIGEGDFDNNDFEDLNKKDLLTKSLIMMRQNLKHNKDEEHRSIWINNGKSLISDELRKTTDLDALSFNVLKSLLEYCNIIQGRFYIWDKETEQYTLRASYAYNRKKNIKDSFKIGEGLIGTSAYEFLSIYRTEIPAEYTTITSGILKDKKPGSIFIMPLVSENMVQGVIEVADINDFIESEKRELIETIGPIIGQVLFSVSVNVNTKHLLNESQALTEELRKNEEELQLNAEEMLITHEELEKTNEELEQQINEAKISKGRLHSLLVNASEVISIFNGKGEIIYESPSVESVLGYTATELIGTNGIKRVFSDHINLVIDTFKELLNKPDNSVNYSFKIIKKDGTTIWVETTGRNMLDNPSVQGIIFNTRDITVQRMAEKEQLMKSQMQSLSENSPDLIIRFGIDGKLHYVNPKVNEYLGFNQEQLQEKMLNDTMLSKDIKELFNERISTTISNNTILETEFETIINNKKVCLKINTIPEYNDDKEIRSILLVAHDLTEIKAIEREVVEKNHKLNDSINYAQRIQTSILPTNDIIKSHFSDSFIFYKARDVVSGDYPWFKANDNGIYLAAVDCTGHGVPGALLSFIGYFLLNDIVNSNPNDNSAKLLDKFDAEVKNTLKQGDGRQNTRDGMDIGLCRFSNDGKQLSFAGAHRPLYLIRDNQLIKIKGDRRPIGGIIRKNKEVKDFANHNIDLLKGDKIFIFSDGLSDQFKEGTLEKFKEKQVQQIILENHHLSMAEIHNVFEQRLANWQGNYRQVDDMLLIGIEI